MNNRKRGCDRHRMQLINDYLRAIVRFLVFKKACGHTLTDHKKCWTPSPHGKCRIPFAEAIQTRYIRFLVFLPKLSIYIISANKWQLKAEPYPSDRVFWAPISKTSFENFASNQEVKWGRCSEGQCLVDKLGEVISLPCCGYHEFTSGKRILCLSGKNDWLLGGLLCHGWWGERRKMFITPVTVRSASVRQEERERILHLYTTASAKIRSWNGPSTSHGDLVQAQSAVFLQSLLPPPN